METTLVFPGSFKSLDKVSEFIENVARSAGFDDNAVYAIEIAVDEAFSNIIDHAYAGENHGNIECTCKVDAQGLTITLKDRGEPFDPNSVAEPVLDCCLDDRKERGLGLYIMRKLMDDIHFDFSKEQGNVLTMTKFKDKQD
jgi:serine/threonine-protein kinase RsbW